MACQSTPFQSYGRSIPQTLDALGAGPVFAEQELILLKPNLVNSTPFPVTTPPALCEAVIHYTRDHSQARIVIAEGCGDAYRETPDIFAALGYAHLAESTGVELLDLNHAPLITLRDENRTTFPVMHLPEIAFQSYLVSLPVLKAHSLAQLTGSLKNMMGLAPPKHYAGVHGTWKKARFHQRMQDSILDLVHYRAPDLTLMDATVGLRDFHLGGAECDPHPNLLLAGYDARAVDREAAGLLGLDWREIGHLTRD